jgi:RND family efflux transporter MFP subunit
LDSTTAPAEVIQAISTLVTAQQELTTAKESKTTLAEAEVALNTAQDAYYQALGYSYTLNKPVGSEDYNAILKSTLIKAEQAVTKAEDYYAGFGEYADSDPKKAAALASLAQARIDLKGAQSIYNYYTSTPNSMDTAQITANLNLATAQLDDAKRAYDLIKNGNNSDAVTSAQAAVDAAQATVNQLSIIAPFDGQVAVVYSQVGDVVTAGTQALVLVDRTSLYIDVLIDETSISRVQVGNTAAISFDSLGINTTGKVTRIDPIGTTSSGVVNYTVRVELDKSDPKILIGSTATVVITTGNPQSVLFVPVSAVLSDAQGEYVMRVNSSGATERVTVVSGQIVDTNVVVVGDLKKGDVVELNSSSTTSSTSSQNSTKSESTTSGGMNPGDAGGQPPSGGAGPLN